MRAEMRSPLQSHADDHAERVGTRPRCNWEPPEWWWVTAEADPAPDGIECARHNRCQAQSTRKHQTSQMVSTQHGAKAPQRGRSTHGERLEPVNPPSLPLLTRAHATTANCIENRCQRPPPRRNVKRSVPIRARWWRSSMPDSSVGSWECSHTGKGATWRAKEHGKVLH